MATMDDVEIAVSLKDNVSSGMGKIKNTFNGLKSAGGSALNSLANRIPLNSRNDVKYYESELAQIPEIDDEELSNDDLDGNDT